MSNGPKKLTEITSDSADPKGKYTTYNPNFASIAKNIEGKSKYHHHGLPSTITSEESGETISTGDVDEGQFSEIKYNIPEKPYVIAQSTGDKYQKDEKFWLNY